jgi:hypothetical protein
MGARSFGAALAAKFGGRVSGLAVVFLLGSCGSANGGSFATKWVVLPAASFVAAPLDWQYPACATARATSGGRSSAPWI